MSKSVKKCHFFPHIVAILIVTTVRSPGRADPPFLAIKPLGFLPAAGLGFAKTLNYYGFTKRLRRGAKSDIFDKCDNLPSGDQIDSLRISKMTICQVGRQFARSASDDRRRVARRRRRRGHHASDLAVRCRRMRMIN